MAEKPILIIQEKLMADKAKAEALKGKSNPTIKDIYDQNRLITELLLNIKEKLN